MRGLCGQASKPLFNTDALYEEPTLKIEEAVEAALSNHAQASPESENAVADASEEEAPDESDRKAWLRYLKVHWRKLRK